jgi:hypothetical protein
VRSETDGYPSSGKSLEEMAEIFGDQIDTVEVLAQHGDMQLVHEIHEKDSQE